MKLTNPTNNPIILRPVQPNRGIEAAYKKRLQAMTQEMAKEYLREIKAALAQGGVIAQDSPLSFLKSLFLRLGNKWAALFDEAADNIATNFGTGINKATSAQINAELRRVGFAIEFKPSEYVSQAYQASIAENVGLIKTIPAQFHSQIEGMVYRSVASGFDIAELTRQLKATYGVTHKRAAFIAKDQTNKMTAVIERAQQQELGIEEAIWRHSHAGKEPRPSHVEANGKTYNIDKGMYLDGVWTWPGVEINCRCLSLPIIPGFKQ